VSSEFEHESLGLSRAAAVRVLVAEDFAAFRQFICSKLGKSPDFRVIGEASDGLEALQMAVELRPDLILLDIGLPSLNGIEVARQMRSLVPESIIIFLTQESSFDVLQEAVAVGAQGYVVKAMAGSKLLAAMEAVLSGKTFVSSSCKQQFHCPD
jgi:DNA-binding NarL/FixJ family response regulator